MSLDLLKEKFGHFVSKNKKDADNKEKIDEKLNTKFNSNGLENIKSNVKSLNSQDQLDLLKERFSHSASTNKKEADNGEKINEKLNVKFNDIQNLKSLDSQHKGELEEKDIIIKNLKEEIKSQWLTNKTAFNTKKCMKIKLKK